MSIQEVLTFIKDLEKTRSVCDFAVDNAAIVLIQNEHVLLQRLDGSNVGIRTQENVFELGFLLVGLFDSLILALTSVGEVLVGRQHRSGGRSRHRPLLAVGNRGSHILLVVAHERSVAHFAFVVVMEVAYVTFNTSHDVCSMSSCRCVLGLDVALLDCGRENELEFWSVMEM